ncbi:hypothetical protein [Altererythrobacter sp. MF3-039]|uniref:hypothetical protein n=1 Tax=Altererythrobacter sp. MF3-039 TaxID=3252901 RepID=UPI00390C4079
MKLAKLAAAALVLTASPAMAQDVGSTVMGNDDAPIGQVIANDGTTVTIDTGMHQVPLPANAFGTGEAGPTLNISKTQLDEMMTAQLAQQEAAMAEAQAAAEAEAAAKLQAALVVGAPVITADEQPLGMVDEFIGDNVIVKAEDETLVTLPRNLFGVDGEGALMALANHADIMAALEAVGG